MKKFLSYLLTLVVVFSAQAQSGIITSTPTGTLYPTVYGGSGKTYLLSQGGFGSFADNYGYCSSIVIDGDDMYIHNVIREYPGIDSWVKGQFTEDGVVEFEFPQPVAVDPNTGTTLYASMVKAGIKEGIIALVPDTESPCLKLKSNETRDKFSQIMPSVSDDDIRGEYLGMIGLVDAEGTFMSYAEQNVSYEIWNKLPEIPSADIATLSYTGEYKDNWNDTFKRLVKIGIEGKDAWIRGLCDALPEAWIKGSVREDGSIVLDSKQYLGVANDYLYFMSGVEKDASGSYSIVPSVELKPVEGGYEAAGSMVFNLGCNRVFLGIMLQDLKLSLVVDSDPIPVNPEFGDPEWDANDGMGVADVLILPESVDGQALDPENLFYRVFFDGELAALEYDDNDNPITDLKYGKESDLILFMYDWHFIIFFEPLKSIGVQSVYKVGDKEYCSDIVTYEFQSSEVSDISGEAKDVVSEYYYSMDGTQLANPTGICIRKVIYSDGSASVSKIMRK